MLLMQLELLMIRKFKTLKYLYFNAVIYHQKYLFGRFIKVTIIILINSLDMCNGNL
jgi:hypothetical protein